MPSRSREDAPIAILTDFGYQDHYVGAMKGVIARIAPGARLIDLTHGIPPQSIVAGALALRESWSYFPKRTIFLAVVDPGVGTARAPIAIETRAGARFVGPDNGLLALATEAAEVKSAVKLSTARYRMQNVSSTFHGRDVFAPAAAYLWRGVPLKSFGPRIDRIERLEFDEPKRSAKTVKGRVIYVDAFGNLITNIGREALAQLDTAFPGRVAWVRIDRSAPMKLVEAYGYALKGALLATIGSFNLLEVAVRDGSAAKRLGASVGAAVTVTTRPGQP
ncbi:MAG TPA: SAM-dependent chlorinase/fluorinase [Candidatus Binataceae bacterium]|nr:SAM-dependent chlorinase/fluorinase [Candidatus Binataceae bacterium]